MSLIYFKLGCKFAWYSVWVWNLVPQSDNTEIDIENEVLRRMGTLGHEKKLQGTEEEPGQLSGIALGLRAGRSGIWVPAGAGNFSLHHRIQISSGAHLASYPMSTRGSFPGDKAAGA
jgi:hypothetical protein